jgi:hypothetical protein
MSELKYQLRELELEAEAGARGVELRMSDTGRDR